MLLAAAPVLVAGAYAAPPPPDPCKVVTAAEMQQIMGPLSGTPTGTDPKSGEISCSYTPAKGPSFVEVTLHEGDLAAWCQGQQVSPHGADRTSLGCI